MREPAKRTTPWTAIRAAVFGVPLTSGANVFTLNYTNTVGATSTATYTVNVSTPITR